MATNKLDKSLQEALDTMLKLKTGFSDIDKTILSAAKNAKSLADMPLDKGTPKEVNDRLQKSATYRKQVNEQLKEQQRLEKALASAQAKFYSAQSSHNRDLQQTRFETNALNKKYREQAVLSSKLATEYQKQSVILNRLRRRYKDVALVQGENSVEARKLQREVQELDGKLKKVDANVGQFQRSVGNYGKAWGNVGGIVRSAMAAFGVFSALDIGRQIIGQIKEIDALDKALIKVTESQLDFNETLSFLQDLGERSGIAINTLEQAYTKFYASARNTNLTLEQIREIFDSVAMSGASLGLSTEDVTGAFRALEQMLSKGKVQAEEIRGQLGERLPGAFQILAESMGVTTSELDKMLEQGQVIADEVLPNFAKELKKTFDLDTIDRVDTLNAAQGRLSNSWNKFVRTLSDSQGTISKVLMSVYKGLAFVADGLRLINDGQNIKEQDVYNQSLEKQLQLYKDLGDEAKAVAEIDVNSATSNINDLEAEIKAYEDKNKALKEDSRWMLKHAAEVYQNQKAIDELNVSLSRETARRNAAARQLIDHTEWLEKNTEAEDKNTEAAEKRAKLQSVALEKNNKIIEGSIEWHEQLISFAEKAQEKLNDPAAYEKLQTYIDNLKESVKVLKGEFENFEGFEISESQNDILNFDAIFAGMENLSGLVSENVRDLMEEYLKETEGAYQKDYNAFLKWSQKKIEQADEENKLKKEKLAEWMQYAGDVIYEVGSLAMAFSERKIQKYEEEIEANNKMYETWLENENLTETERKQLEKEREQRNAELEKKKKKEQEKQAKIDKATAAFQIGINTAVAIMRAFADLGPVAGVPASIAIGALGALQVATVLAKPIPKYKKGRKGGQAEIAEVGDGGVSEVVTDKSGKFKYITPAKSTYTYLEQGDKVIPNVQSWLDGITMDDLNRASIMTSLQSQSNALSSKQTQENLSKNIEDAIYKGYLKVKVPQQPAPDYNRLARQIASELQFSKRRDV